MGISEFHRRASVLALVIAAGISAPARAEETAKAATADQAAPAAAPAAEEAQGGEIVVTAQKRSESAQSVPISIAAFNSAGLARSNVTNVLELGRIATNFQSVRASNTASTRVNIRGVGALGNTLIEPSVAVFVDGVYVPRSGSILGTFLDIDGVEVLRGPQGTLFGRNASVGALSLKSALPKQELSGQVTGETGSFDRYKLNGFINVPLGDRVALRVAGMGSWFAGPWINKLDGKSYGGSDDLALRGTLKADLGAIKWVVRADYSKMKGDGANNFDLDASSISAARLAFIKTAFNGGPDTNTTDRVMNQLMATGLTDKHWGVSSTASTEFNGATVKLINSYRRWTNNQLDGDIVFFPVSLASRLSTYDSRSQNHELQFISPERQWLGGKFDMVAGLYYYEENFNLGEQLNMGSSFCGVLVPAGAARTACGNYYTSTGGTAATNQLVFQNVKSFAAYTQGNVHVTDQLTLTLGGRWTSDKKTGTYSQTSSPFTQTLRAPEALTFPGLSDNRFTYRVSLNYKPSDAILVFANVSTGYKSGGYNSGGGTPSLSTFDSSGNLISTKRVFDRETTKNYELGIKSRWFDHMVKANLTLYRMDIAGYQDRAFDGVSFIVRNAGNLRQQGAEADLSFAPARHFSLSGSLAYLDSKFTSFTTASNLPGLTGTQDLTGKPNTYSPKWMGSMALDWSGDIGSTGLGWAFNEHMNFMGSQYVGGVTDANPQTLAHPYALLGARLTVSGPGDRWSVALFGENLANKHYTSLITYQPLGAQLGLNNTVFAGSTATRPAATLPTTWGASATFKF